MEARSQVGPSRYQSLTLYGIPLLSIALSLPTLIGVLALGMLAGYHAATGRMTDLGAARAFLDAVLHPPLVAPLLLLYVVLGPMLAGVLCLVQRAGAPYAHTPTSALNARSARLNTVALLLSAVTTGLLLLAVFVGFGLRGGT